MEQHLLRAFAGLINQLRQRGLGFSHYVWRSSDDDKVRSSHAAHDDRLFRWDDPPQGGHPGQAFNCRCHAEPFVPGLSPGFSDPQDDPIGFIDAFLSGHEPGISAGTGVRPREAILDYLMPPEPGVTINGEMLSVQTQGDLSTAFLNLDRAISQDPARFLGLLARHGVDFTTLAQAFGRTAPENFAVAALLATSGAPDFTPFMEHPSGVRAVEIEMTGRNATDFRRANIAAGHPEWGSQAPEGWTWHHNQDGLSMELIPHEVNQAFSHLGGASMVRRTLQ